MFSKLFSSSSAASASRMVDAELAEAGIPVVTVDDGGSRYGVGLLQFGNAQVALFRRVDDYYVVTLAETPTGDQSLSIDAIDGVSETGFERFHRHETPEADADIGIRCWCVSHQLGLNRLVIWLHELYGVSQVDMTPDGQAFTKLMTLLTELDLTGPQLGTTVVMYSDNGQDTHHNRRFTPSGRTVVLKDGERCLVRPVGDPTHLPWLDAEIVCAREMPEHANTRACVACNADLRHGNGRTEGRQYVAGCQQDTFYVRIAGDDGCPDVYVAVARIVLLHSQECEVTFELDAGVEFHEAH